MMPFFIELFAVVLSSLAFGLIFNIRGKHLVFAIIGGFLSWFVYVITAGIYENDIPQYILAAAAMSLYCEVAARINKTPVTMYLVVGLIPLVPGWLIYQTMLSFINSDSEEFIPQLMYAVSIAGAIALGVVSVSSIFRFFTEKIRKRKANS